MKTMLIGICVALGIGLLAGAERERKKDTGPDRSAAGIRTFTIASLMGAISMALGGIELLALTVFLVGLGIFIAYQKNQSEDPGLTTELALILTCILGGFAMHDALLAAGVGVMQALILAARRQIHYFVRELLTEQELHDALYFAAFALIVLPLAPNQFMGPFNAFNPRNLVTLIVVVMAISAVGYVATRWLGPRFGLPLAGFASGFVSSAATIHSMGQRAAGNVAELAPAVSGAVLSSIATYIQLFILVALVTPELLFSLAVPLVLGGLAATLYGLIYLLKGSKESAPEQLEKAGRAINLKSSVIFAFILAVVMMTSAALNVWLGDLGILLSAMVAGLADAHSAGASTASLVAAGKIQANHAVLPILLGLTTNSVTKAVVAYQAGGRIYAYKIIPGLVLMMLATWIGYWIIF